MTAGGKTTLIFTPDFHGPLLRSVTFPFLGLFSKFLSPKWLDLVQNYNIIMLNQLYDLHVGYGLPVYDFEILMQSLFFHLVRLQPFLHCKISIGTLL